MVVVLIRTILREGADVAAYEQLNARMEAMVQAVPGFLSANDVEVCEVARAYDFSR